MEKKNYTSEARNALRIWKRKKNDYNSNNKKQKLQGKRLDFHWMTRNLINQKSTRQVNWKFKKSMESSSSPLQKRNSVSDTSTTFAGELTIKTEN